MLVLFFPIMGHILRAVPKLATTGPWNSQMAGGDATIRYRRANIYRDLLHAENCSVLVFSRMACRVRGTLSPNRLEKANLPSSSSTLPHDRSRILRHNLCSTPLLGGEILITGGWGA